MSSVVASVSVPSTPAVGVPAPIAAGFAPLLDALLTGPSGASPLAAGATGAPPLPAATSIETAPGADQDGAAFKGRMSFMVASFGAPKLAGSAVSATAVASPIAPNLSTPALPPTDALLGLAQSKTTALTPSVPSGARDKNGASEARPSESDSSPTAQDPTALLAQTLSTTVPPTFVAAAADAPAPVPSPAPGPQASAQPGVGAGSGMAMARAGGASVQIAAPATTASSTPPADDPIQPQSVFIDDEATTALSTPPAGETPAGPLGLAQPAVQRPSADATATAPLLRTDAAASRSGNIPAARRTPAAASSQFEPQPGRQAAALQAAGPTPSTPQPSPVDTAPAVVAANAQSPQIPLAPAAPDAASQPPQAVAPPGAPAAPARADAAAGDRFASRTRGSARTSAAGSSASSPAGAAKPIGLAGGFTAGPTSQPGAPSLLLAAGPSSGTLPDSVDGDEPSISDGGPLPTPVDVSAASPQQADANLPAGAAPTPANAAASGAPPAAAQARAGSETVQSLAAEMIRKLDQRTSRFEVALNPAGLGRVNVSVEIGAGGHVTAALACDQSQAAADLQGRAHELEGALRDAGFDVAPGGLSFSQTGSGLADERSPSPQDFSGGETRARSTPSSRAFGAAAERIDLPQPRSSRLASGLDIQV